MGQARAVLLNCEQAPAYLPYKLLRLVQRHAKGTLNATQVKFDSVSTQFDSVSERVSRPEVGPDCVRLR